MRPDLRETRVDEAIRAWGGAVPRQWRRHRRFDRDQGTRWPRQGQDTRARASCSESATRERERRRVSILRASCEVDCPLIQWALSLSPLERLPDHLLFGISIAWLPRPISSSWSALEARPTMCSPSRTVSSGKRSIRSPAGWLDGLAPAPPGWRSPREPSRSSGANTTVCSGAGATVARRRWSESQVISAGRP